MAAELDNSDTVTKNIICEAVISNIQAVMDNTYTETHIREVFDDIYPKNSGKTEQEISKKVLQRLMKGKTDRRNTSKVSGKGKNFNIDTAVKLINESVGDPNNPF